MPKSNENINPRLTSLAPMGSSKNKIEISPGKLDYLTDDWVEVSWLSSLIAT